GADRVAQFELRAGQGNRLRRIEEAAVTAVEGDGRVSRGRGVVESDGFAQAQEARPGGQSIPGGIHDQGGNGRPCVGQCEGKGEAREGCDDGVAAQGVVGRDGEGGLAVGDDRRRLDEDGRGAVDRGIGDEAYAAAVDRLDRVVGG